MRFSELLRSFSNKKIYYKPNLGNGGDALIAAGAFEYFSKYNVEYEIIRNLNGFKAEGKVIFYAGGGNLIEEYDHCAIFLKKYHDKAEKIILMPHTINGHFDLLKSLGQNTVLFAREKKSFDLLKSLELRCEILLDHDLAFILEPLALMTHSSNLWRKYSRIVYFKKLLSFNSQMRNLNAFRTDVEKTDKILPFDNLDVSRKILYNNKMDDVNTVSKNSADIFNFLNGYDQINTNRLHIAIAGALLGKKVNLYPNSYWKNEAIYYYSLQNEFPNVKFVEHN